MEVFKIMSATQRLLEGFEDRDYDMVEQAILDGADVNYIDEKQESMLMKAVVRGYPDIVKMLVGSPEIQMNHVDLNGNNACLLAAEIGNVKVLEQLRGSDIHQRNNSGLTAIMVASRGGYTQCIKQLLDWGAKINERDEKGNASLAFAAMENKGDAIEMLLERGSDSNGKDIFGYTALMYAINRNATEAVRVLSIYKHININQRNNNMDTALQVAVLKGNPLVVFYLLKNESVNLEVKDINGMTPIAQAIQMYGVESKVARLIRIHIEIKKLNYGLNRLKSETIKIIKF